jgi:predicted XRE-type DNA-binding protein
MKNREKTPSTFDPCLERLVRESDTSSDRIRAKLADAYGWGFCELCWRSTEYSISIEAQMVFRRLQRGNLKAVPLTNSIRITAQKKADALVARYERACNGEFGPYEPGRMLMTCCEMVEMRGDHSVPAFREQVERRALLSAWARHGELLRPTKLPGQPEGAAKPSKLYCEEHNPKRSDEARRAYQRDRRLATKYLELIEKIWAENAAVLPAWDIEAHAYVRREAYNQLQVLKCPTSAVDELLAQGTMSQAEIARQLGISRQAVSASIKRRKQK